MVLDQVNDEIKNGFSSPIWTGKCVTDTHKQENNQNNDKMNQFERALIN